MNDRNIKYNANEMIKQTEFQMQIDGKKKIEDIAIKRNVRVRDEIDSNIETNSKSESIKQGEKWQDPADMLVDTSNKLSLRLGLGLDKNHIFRMLENNNNYNFQYDNNKLVRLYMQQQTLFLVQFYLMTQEILMSNSNINCNSNL